MSLTACPEGQKVRRLLVEDGADIKKEYYIVYREQSMKFNGLQNEVEGLKKDIHDIKDLLLKLVNGNKND